MNSRINYIALGAGVFMIILSIMNYFMNEDHVSLGIFIFSGIGFTLISIKDKYEKRKSERIKKYSLTFFFAAVIIMVYWLIAGKFDLF